MGWELATPHSLRGFYETSVPADFTSYAPMSLKAGVLSSPGLSPKKTRSKRGEARECARLRAEQKKVSDGLEALDGLRARRAAEYVVVLRSGSEEENSDVDTGLSREQLATVRQELLQGLQYIRLPPATV